MSRPLSAFPVAAALVLPSCTPLHLADQLDPADREYPVPLPLVSEKNKQETTSYLYLYRGQYYLPLSIGYATRNTLLLHDNCPHRYTFTGEAPQAFFFPLSDAEVAQYLKQPRSRVQQPYAEGKGRVFPAAGFPLSEARKVPFDASRLWLSVPQSVQLEERTTLWNLGKRSCEYLPVRKGERGVLNYAGVGLAYPLEITINTAATVAAMPVAAFGLLVCQGISPDTWSFLSSDQSRSGENAPSVTSHP